MRFVALSTIFLWTIIIVACSQPFIKPVDKDQDYKIPEGFNLTGLKVSQSTAEGMCGQRTYGCLINKGNNYTLVYTSKSVLEHELNHLIYGFKHKEG